MQYAHGLDKHYEEKTPYISFDGKTPFGNSLPASNKLLNPKFKKILKKSGVDSEEWMSVFFEKPQDLEQGSTLEWKLREVEHHVYLIDAVKLLVKGKYFWVYTVGIIK